MTLRPCLDCGEPTNGPRCPEHTTDPKASATTRGYNDAWTRLSKRARRLQSFCLDCGSTEDLQTDHTPEAWARKARGKTIRLQDVDVVCGPCNRARGAARGNALTRGNTPNATQPDPGGRPSLRMRPKV
jgi:5-methylcytosine-specific restriction protein A